MIRVLSPSPARDARPGGSSESSGSRIDLESACLTDRGDRIGFPSESGGVANGLRPTDRRSAACAAGARKLPHLGLQVARSGLCEAVQRSCPDGPASLTANTRSRIRGGAPDESVEQHSVRVSSHIARTSLSHRTSGRETWLRPGGAELRIGSVLRTASLLHRKGRRAAGEYTLVSEHVLDLSGARKCRVQGLHAPVQLGMWKEARAWWKPSRSWYQ